MKATRDGGTPGGQATQRTTTFRPATRQTTNYRLRPPREVRVLSFFVLYSLLLAVLVF